MNLSAEKQYQRDPGGTVLLVGEDSESLEYVRSITQGMGYSVRAK